MPSAIEEEIELTAPSPVLSRAPALSRSSTFDKSDFTRPSSYADLPTLAREAATLSNGNNGRDSPVEEPAQRLRRMSMGDETDHEGRQLPPVDGGRGAWLFVIAGFILETFIWGYSYSFPSILVYLQTHDPWQRSSLAALSAVGTILLAIQFILPVAIITVFRRYPDWVKAMLWVSVVVNCGSMLAASWATKVVHLVILQGVLGGISGAVLYAPVLLWLNEWWHERRGLASGIVFAGTGIGGLAFPFALSALLNRGGFALMCRVWAGITLAVYCLSVWAIRPRIPPRKPVGGRGPWLAVDWRFLKDPVVLAMAFTTALSSLSIFPVTLYLPTFALNFTTAHNSDIIVSIYNLATSIGSTFTGYASDASLPATVTVMGFVGGLLAVSAWGMANSLGAIFGFGIAFAIFTQICSCWGAAARDGAGSNPHTSTLVFCLFGIVRGICSIVGPYIATALYDPKDTTSSADANWGRYGFRGVIIFVGLMSFLSAFGGIGLAWARAVKKKRGTVAVE
ncbi:hypothetical protein JCM8097_006184 [Rhodosporidiobolus ruineniae]